jgi:uncharacterized protein YkwD
MKCATTSGLPTIPTPLYVRLVLALGLLASLIPGVCASAGTQARGHSKKAAQPKRHREVKHAVHPRAPAPVPVNAHAPLPNVATPQPTFAIAAAPGPSTPPTAPSLTADVGTAPPASPAVPASSIDEQIFTLTNQAREANDLGALTLDDGLTQAAQIQASAMALLDVMSHTLPSMPQPTLANRLQFVGYDYSWAAENIAFGASDAASVFALWMSSPPHEENILSPLAMATGIAVAYDSHGVLYFCQVFGAPQ